MHFRLKELMHQIIQMNTIPFGYVEVGNTASVRLTEKIPNQTIHPEKVAWITLQQPSGNSSKL